MTDPITGRELTKRDKENLSEYQRILEEFSDIDPNAVVDEVNEHLYAVLKELAGDSLHHYLALPDERIRLVPAVFRLYTAGFPVGEIASLVGVGPEKISRMISYALRTAVLVDTESVRHAIYQSLRELQRRIAPNVTKTPRWAEIYLQTLEAQMKLFGLTGGTGDRSIPAIAPMFQQIQINTGGKDKLQGGGIVVEIPEAIEGEIVDNDEQ